jgi:DeoR/GlpR family transcriptional regulator of sugar metabolism
MALTTIKTLTGNFGEGGACLSGKDPDSLRANLENIKAVAAELQGLSFALVNGAAADTAITVTGITDEDTLKFVLGLAEGTLSDFTADFAITADDEITAATQATTGNQLLVIWYDKQ